ncbi:MAG: hypothetical protein RMK49_03220 [Abditibacteriales bacterium]|nr:hypothetical protein [Abditibacteriales bacterium]
MRKIIIGFVVGLVVSLSAVRTAHAQQDLEVVPEEIAQQVIALSVEELKKVTDAPLKVEVDARQSTVLGTVEMGGVAFLTHKNVTEDALKKSDKEVVPLGVLGLYRLALVADKKTVPADKLCPGTIVIEGMTFVVSFCLVGVKTEQEGKRQLMIYGKDKEPLVKVPLNEFETKVDRSVSIECRVGGGEGTLTLNVIKKFQAIVPLKQAS